MEAGFLLCIYRKYGFYWCFASTIVSGGMKGEKIFNTKDYFFRIWITLFISVYESVNNLGLLF